MWVWCAALSVQFTCGMLLFQRSYAIQVLFWCFNHRVFLVFTLKSDFFQKNYYWTLGLAFLKNQKKKHFQSRFLATLLTQNSSKRKNSTKFIFDHSSPLYNEKSDFFQKKKFWLWERFLLFKSCKSSKSCE
jgi:hypothetical protein